MAGIQRAEATLPQTSARASRGATDFDPPLDPGIRGAVLALMAAGIETYESCEGGTGHAYPEPTVRFHGGVGVGFRALAAAQEAGLPVSAVRRVWTIIDLEPRGPYWEMTFSGPVC